MSEYKVKYNRTTNHIAGIEERTKGGGLTYSVSACGSLSRSVNFATSSAHDDLSDALYAARIAGGRKLCKNCEKAALAALEAETPAAVEDETKHVISFSGGKVHEMMPGMEDHPFPLCRTGAMTNSGTKYTTTTAPLSCKVCMENAERREAHEDRAIITPVSFKGTDEGDEMPPKKKTADVDALISEVHATIDEIKEIDPSEEGATTHANELSSEAETKIRSLPVAKRNTLRAEVKSAREAVTAPSTEMEKAPARDAAENFYDIEGVKDLVSLGAEKAREGVEFGVKMGSVSESVAHVILDIATRITNPDTGLPDLMKERKTTKNAASEIYALARKDVDEDDIQRQTAHNSLAKSVQNRNSDVLVDWLRAFDNSDDNEVLTELFPSAAEMVETGDMKPSEAIRKVYADKGVSLPERGRTEIERERAKVKRLEKARKELETAKEAAEEGDEEAAEKAQKLAERVQSLEESLPTDAYEKAPEKTAQEKAFEKLTKAQNYFAAATKGADKLSEDEKADLKAKLNEMVSALAAEAAKL